MEASHINTSLWEIFVKTKKEDGVEVGLDAAKLDLNFNMTFKLYGIRILSANTVPKSRAQH